MAIHEINDQHLLTFSDFIREKTGLTFDKSNWYALKVSVGERMSAKSVDQPLEYFMQIKDDLKECEELISLLTVSETYFFRDRRQFEVLREHVLPEMIERKKKTQGRPKIKIASCGCSLGAEPYSIAIAIDQGGFQEADFEIIACDINKKSIEFAREAIYSDHYFREPETDISGYFERQGKKIFLKDSIKEKVRFYCANLMDLSASSFNLQDADIIFFRNVLIYFNEDTVIKTIQVFEKALDKNGYLFLGPFETLMRRETSFIFNEIGQALVWRLKEASVPVKERVSLPPPNIVMDAPPPAVFVDKVIKGDESHYEKAAGYFHIKRNQIAEKEFQEQLKITPDHVPSLVGLAFLYADVGDSVLALEYCQKALKVDNLIADAYFIQGLVLFQMKDFEEALKLFKKTVYCDDKHFVAQYFLALTYKEFNRPQQANHQFRVAIHAIDDLGKDGLTRELAGHCGNYILSLCLDNVT